MTIAAGHRALTQTEEAFFKKMKDTANVILNDVQMNSCLHVGTQLLLAAPGTGKTTTTITKIGYMIDVLQVNPARILAVTFSSAAAIDMQKRFSLFFPEHPDGIVHFSTIHALAFEIFRKYMNREKLAYKLIEDVKGREKKQSGVIGKTALIAKLYEQVTGEYPSDEIRESVQSYISLLKNLLSTPAQLERTNRDVEVVKGAAEVYELYEEYKKNQAIRLIDFDDMLVEAIRILENDDEICNEYQQKFDFLLMDEAQDTSYAQHCIAELLSEQHQNLFMVADDDQTIYGFRGSDVTNLLIFKDKYPNGVVFKMEHNYRSSNTIVKTANSFIKNVTERFDKNMFTHKPDGEPIHICHYSSIGMQVQAVLEGVQKQTNLAEVAILYRNNSSAIGVAHALMKQNIPFYVKDVDSRFFNHFVMTDLRNYLRLAYGDKVKHMKLVEDIRTRFKGYVTPKHLKELANFGLDENLWDSLSKVQGMQKYQITFFKECKLKFAKMKTMKPIDAIEMVLNDLGYEKSMKKYVEFVGMNYESIKRVLETIKGIAKSTDSLIEFYQTLDDLANAMQKAKENQGKNAVTLSTFHASKGLEFETVYCIDLQEGQVPTHREREALEKGNEQALDEAFRLFYVAMTRAKNNLFLCSYGKKENCSEFVFLVSDIITGKKGSKEAVKVATKTTDKVKATTVKPVTNVPAKRTRYRGKPTVYKHELVAGIKVEHKSFGEGLIVSIHQDTINVDFKQKGMKILSIDNCLKGKMLAIVS